MRWVGLKKKSQHSSGKINHKKSDKTKKKNSKGDILEKYPRKGKIEQMHFLKIHHALVERKRSPKLEDIKKATKKKARRRSEYCLKYQGCQISHTIALRDCGQKRRKLFSVTINFLPLTAMHDVR